MKQFIVLCGTVALGVFLFRLIAGPEDGSVLGVLEQVWRNEIALRSYTP